MIATNSHILVQEFEYLEPVSIAEATALLAQYGPQARIMAGGTDLLVQLKMERRNPSYVIDISKIPNLCGVSENKGVDIGATTTIRSLFKSQLIGERYTALAEACNWFSTIQIMVMGTVGGNLCNASPAADTAPPLLCFDAELGLASQTGDRTVRIEDFFLGPGKTVLREGELLTAIHLPATPDHTGSAFLKIARVVADISKTCAAVKLVRNAQAQIVQECRIALGSVAPVPVRARAAEAALIGQPFGEELAEHAARIASEEIKPITDVRSTEEYRREVSAVIVRDALELAWTRSGGS
jgi:aerobic carbon-monoxide dehydrogenase medium subunit